MAEDFPRIPLDNQGLNQISASGPGGQTVYLTHPDLVKLPRKGKITFEFTRGPITLREGGFGSAATASVDLRLTEICDVEADEERDEEHSETGEGPIDELFEKARGEEESEADEEKE